MTAEEIRKEIDEAVDAPKDGMRSDQVTAFYIGVAAVFIGEIAAQLAEMNERIEPAPQAPDICGECVIHLIAGASYYPCALPKGHSGGHQGSGVCFKHGHYFGEPGSVPQCPQWPDCVPEMNEKARK